MVFLVKFHFADSPVAVIWNISDRDKYMIADVPTGVSEHTFILTVSGDRRFQGDDPVLSYEVRFVVCCFRWCVV